MSFRGGYYPETLDTIVDFADYATRLRLRAVSSHLCKRVDAVLATHLVWRDGIMYTRTGDFEERHPLSVLNKDLELATASQWCTTITAVSKAATNDCRPSRRHILSASERTSLLNATVRHTRVFDQSAPIPINGSLELPEAVLLRISASYRMYPKSRLEISAPSVKTVVLRKIATHIQHSDGDDYDCDFDLPLFRDSLPTRVVVHIDNNKPSVHPSIALLSNGMQEPHNSELVVVLGADKGSIDGYEVADVFRWLVRPQPHFRTFHRCTVVNPTTQVSERVLEVLFAHFPDAALPNLPALKLGDILRAMLETRNEDLKPEVRYFSLNEWAAELGEGRFKLEMGL